MWQYLYVRDSDIRTMIMVITHMPITPLIPRSATGPGDGKNTLQIAGLHQFHNFVTY